MRLTQITITNFGIYKGENTFNFPYCKNKNVSIIIGKNGAGKTTFLNAFKICLFGSMILKNRTITKSYETYILDKLNKDALKETVPCFSIKANFVSQLQNYDGAFTIERKWDTSTIFKEDVYLHKNDKELSTAEQSSFFNALYHTYPLDLFELFYLDGEKIDQLSLLNANIFTLLESSINIDLFKKLKSDLLTYASKMVNSNEVDNLTTQKELLESKSNQLKELIKSTYHKTDNLENKLDIKADEIKNLKDSLHLETISFDSSKLKKLEQAITELKREIESELTKFLPYTLVTNQLSTLLQKIIEEDRLSKNQTINTALTSKDLIDYLKKEKAIDNVQLLLDKVCAFYPIDQDNLIHNLSNDEYHTLKNKINYLLQFNRNALHAKMNDLSSLEARYSTLSKATSEYETIRSAGQLDTLLSLQSEYDEYKNSFNHYQETLAINKAELNRIEDELNAIDKALWTQLKKSNISNVLDQIHTVLDQYIIEIKTKKIKEIEYHTKKMFDRLIRKDVFINNFKIENDAIYLFDKNDNKLNHTNLSAGEKQLFVLSLLYAILQSSERHVPLMFDTLLGRLDEEHRDNVIKEFISSCPDQVIILATDSELANIDKTHLSTITNTEYSIDFSKTENKMSEVRA